MTNPKESLECALPPLPLNGHVLNLFCNVTASNVDDLFACLYAWTELSDKPAQAAGHNSEDSLYLKAQSLFNEARERLTRKGERKPLLEQLMPQLAKIGLNKEVRAQSYRVLMQEYLSAYAT